MRKNSPILIIVSLILTALGFLLPLWPLGALGIVLAAATGRYFAAILIGLFLDVAYGAPIGRLHFLYMPFTLLALLIAAVRFSFSGYLREEGRDTL